MTYVKLPQVGTRKKLGDKKDRRRYIDHITKSSSDRFKNKELAAYTVSWREYGALTFFNTQKYQLLVYFRCHLNKFTGIDWHFYK